MQFCENTQITITDNKIVTRLTLCNVRIKINRGLKLKKFSSDGELIEDNENVERSLRRAKVQVVDKAMNNNFEFFGTITFNPAWHDVGNPYEVKRKLCKTFDNYKQKYKNFIYLIVPEYGEKTGRLHFHFLISGIPESDLFYNKNRHLDWHLISDNFGHCQIRRIGGARSDVEYTAKYCSKYITKQNIKLGRYRYFCSKSLEKSERTSCQDMRLAIDIKEWLEENGLLPYCESVKCYAYELPAPIFRDLWAKFGDIFTCLREGRIPKRKVFLMPLDDPDLLSPWEVEQCQLNIA